MDTPPNDLAPSAPTARAYDRLELTVNPTERCNLRCRYCYESFTLGKMSAIVIGSVLRLVKRQAQAGLKSLKIDYFGGEPLAAWDVLEPIAAGLYDICKTYGVEQSSGMTTNAVLLTRERLDRLAQLDVRTFQITLDGPEDIHDRRRIGPNGESSYAAVIAALRLFKASKHDLTVTLRLHFDPTTLDRMLGPEGSVADIVRTLAASDPRFRLLFHGIGRLGGPNDASTALFASNAEVGVAIARLKETALAAGLSREQVFPFRKELAGAAPAKPYVCYAAKANAFVIRSDGSLSKCTVALDDGRNRIGRLSSDGELILDSERHAPWMRGLDSGNPRELGCPAIGLVKQLTPT